MTYPTVKKAHIVTAGYLRAWTINDQLDLKVVGHPVGSTPANVRDAGTRGPFYRRTRPDGTRIDDVEHSLAIAEDKMVPALRQIEQRWPPSDDDRSVLAQFVGLQMVRGPLWYEWHRRFQREGFARLRELEAQRAEPDQDSVDATEQWLRTDTEEHIRMLSLAPKVGVVVAGMNWTLLRFRSPVLATSDHPVVTWRETRSRAHSESMTIDGVLRSLELRVPLAPHLALLATWLDLPDEEAQIVEAKRMHAVNLNTFTIGQAERQWFRLPGSTTPTTTGHLLPLSSQLFDGYGIEMARASERRRATAQLIQFHLGRNFPENLQAIKVSRPSIFERARR